MKAFSSSKGFTLMELLVAISLICLFIATIIPTVIQFRQREINWRETMNLEQEAVRFFTYFENRLAGAKNWNVQGNQITVELSELRNGNSIQKRLYQLGDKTIETDIPMGGTLIMAQMVQSIQYISDGRILTILLTLSKGDVTETFQGVFLRSVEQ